MIHINVMSPYLRKLLSNRRFSERNKAKHLERCREYYALNPKAGRDYARKYRIDLADKILDRRYIKGAGEHLKQQLALQNNTCAICKFPFVETPQLDHDHNTNVLRGALCRKCNGGIGMLQDNPEIIEAAAQYLREWSGKIL